LIDKSKIISNTPLQQQELAIEDENAFISLVAARRTTKLNTWGKKKKH